MREALKNLARNALSRDPASLDFIDDPQLKEVIEEVKAEQSPNPLPSPDDITEAIGSMNIGALTELIDPANMPTLPWGGFEEQFSNMMKMLGLLCPNTDVSVSEMMDISNRITVGLNALMELDEEAVFVMQGLLDGPDEFLKRFDTWLNLTMSKRLYRCIEIHANTVKLTPEKLQRVMHDLQLEPEEEDLPAEISDMINGKDKTPVTSG